MKTWLRLCLFLLMGNTVSAQATTGNDAPYKKDPKLPAFNIQLGDSTWFTREMLPKTGYDHTFIIYFSPDCGHCQHEAKEIVKHMDSLSTAYFVFVGFKPLDEIQGFSSYYGLDQFKNVKVGRDPTYFVPSFYRVTRTPFIVAYDSKGLLEKVYDPETTNVPEAEELVQFVNKKY